MTTECKIVNGNSVDMETKIASYIDDGYTLKECFEGMNGNIYAVFTK
jgi:hypothetical protein